MNFVAQLEDYLRDLGAEARKKHPGVKEASERAILKLRTLQNAYVSAVRKASASGERHPDTTLFRSSDLLHPFLLATNYPNASPKLLDTSFKAMKTLMEANAICPGDGMNLVRVWMIQAQVVVSYSAREQNKQNINGTKSGDSTTSSQIPTGAATSSQSSSSSSWFGGFLTSASAGEGASPSSKMTATTNAVVSNMKSAVSSSHGQSGPGGHNQRDLEKLALDILSCLLQLLELRDLPVTHEQWIQSVTLCCLLYLPLKQTVRQAAQSTLPQVLTLLVHDNLSKDSSKSKSKDDNLLAVKTWQDLLACCSASTATYNKKATMPILKGAFSHCKWDGGEKGDAAQPPSAGLSLELMTTILKETPHIFSKVGSQTLQVLLKVFQKHQQLQHANNMNDTNMTTTTTMPLEFLRMYQFLAVILQTQYNNSDWLPECRELVSRILIRPIPVATEAIRKQPDFEDGFIYKVPNRSLLASATSDHTDTNNTAVNSSSISASSSQNSTVNQSSKRIETLQGLPPAVLWKAALALEALKTMVQDKNLHVIWVHADVIVQLLESTSDFCSIGASCEGHMNLLVIACHEASGKDHNHTNTNLLSYEAETLPLDLWNKGKHKDDTFILGETLRIGLDTVLKMIELLDEDLLEAAFAPALAVLQHYLKRFPASGTIVKMSLEGYFSLAKISLKHPLLRRALLSSLCKLSLPQWGTRDPSCRLKDHNIAALIALLNVVHRYYDKIGPEWSIVLQTFQELSILAIASPLVSDNAYVGALSISAVYSRFAAFSTCLSDESLTHFVEGLREVSLLEQTPGVIASPVRGADVLRIPDNKGIDNLGGGGKEERETIGEKLMNIGVRAIYGNVDGDQPEDVPIAERTKNNFYDDYEMDFVRRLSASKHPVRVDGVPFSYSLLADVAMTNSFRYSRCGSTILKQLCVVAAESPTTRHFPMDAVAMLILPMISGDSSLPTSFTGPGRVITADPRQNQYLAVERESEADAVVDSVSQVDLLKPLCDCIRTVKVASVAESGVQALHTILENCGDTLTADAWTEVIQAVASLPSGGRGTQDWANSCLVGFRCLKLIVDDFLDHTDRTTSARTSLLDCCASFGSSRHDVNTSLTAVGLLWSIADQDAGTAAIDRALSKLVQLSSDTRAEVRNCAVNTLFSCIVVRGESFSAVQWQACICSMVFGVYDLVTSKINQEDGADEDQGVGSDSNSRYRVSVHHSRDSAGKQWVATQALVLRGLCRVLRNSFRSLLDTTDDGSDPPGKGKDDTPWFEEAWNKLLGYAFDASTQVGGRDTLDLRNSGVELLVLCNQLACSAGVEAAITPARVGTNMEVVNGALRSVRTPAEDKTASGKSFPRKSHSAVIDVWRENLFLDAFDVLDSYRDYLESDAASHKEAGLHPYMEPTQVQVLSKFAGDLSKLYDCCKENEFLEDKTFSKLASFDKLLSKYSTSPSENDSLVERFVRLVSSVATKSYSGPDARFLSQAQRSCIDLFRSMSKFGSPEALICLTRLSGTTYFSARDENGKAMKGVDILCHEAASVLHGEISNSNISDECRVLILIRILSVYLDECAKGDSAWSSNVGVTTSYKLLVKLATVGFESAKKLETGMSSSPSTGNLMLLDSLWKIFTDATTMMLSPKPKNGTKLLKIFHSEDLKMIVNQACRNAPQRHAAELCAVLTSGASKSLELAHVVSDHDTLAEVRLHQQQTLSLFGACFDGVCRMNPKDPRLKEIAGKVFSVSIKSVRGTTDIDLGDVNIQACMTICKAMKDTDGAENLAIAVFTHLCQLVGVEDPVLRQAVGGVLAKVDVGRILEDSQIRCEQAEQRANTAERQVLELTQEIERLTKEKAVLEGQLPVF